MIPEGHGLFPLTENKHPGKPPRVVLDHGMVLRGENPFDSIGEWCVFKIQSNGCSRNLLIDDKLNTGRLRNRLQKVAQGVTTLEEVIGITQED